MDTRTLQTPLEALQWALAFVQTDLADARMADLQRHRQALDAFLNPLRPTTCAPVPPLDRAGLMALQAVLQSFLRDIAGRGHVEVDLRLRFWAVRQRRPGKKAGRRYGPPDPGAWRPEVDVLVYGEPNDWVRYRAIRLLEDLGAEKLLICPAPECGRLFFKVTRKEFCSTRCQSRIYMRGYRS
jgi:CGNR zinc finger